MMLYVGENVSIVVPENKWNQYEVIEANEKFASLRCTYFMEPEDLGDAIVCNRIGQEICIAQYFSYKFMVNETLL